MDQKRIIGLEEIRAFVRGQHDGKTWAHAREDLASSLARHFADGLISENDYVAFDAEIEARVERYQAAEDRRTGGGGVGALVGGLISHLREPTQKLVTEIQETIPGDQEPESDPSLPSLPPQRRRGPSQHDAKERKDRRLWRKGQAKLAKCPAEVWRNFDHAQASALSIVLYDIFETGECTRPIARIAGAVKVSPRTVQTMLAAAQARRELAVERRTLPNGRSIPSRIILTCPRIQAYQDDLRGRDRSPPSGSPFFDSEISYTESPPFEGANLVTLPSEDVSEDGELLLEALPTAVESKAVDVIESRVLADLAAPEPAWAPTVVGPASRPIAGPSRTGTNYRRTHQPLAPDKLEQDYAPGTRPLDGYLDGVNAMIAGGKPEPEPPKPPPIEATEPQEPQSEHPFDRIARLNGLPPRPRGPGS